MSATDLAVAAADPRQTTAAIPAVEWPTVALSRVRLWRLAAADVAHTASGRRGWSCRAPPCCSRCTVRCSTRSCTATRRARSRSIACSASWPLSLWIPYDRFRVLHLVHHDNSRLTDPHRRPGIQLLDAAGLAGAVGVPAPHDRAAADAGRSHADRLVVADRAFLGAGGTRARARRPGRARRVAAAPAAVRAGRLLGDGRLRHPAVAVRAGDGDPRQRAAAGAFVRRAPRARRGAASARRPSRARGSSGRCSSTTTCTRCTTPSRGLPWYRYNARYRVRREQLAGAERRTRCTRRTSTSRDASCSRCTTSRSIRSAALRCRARE